MSRLSIIPLEDVAPEILIELKQHLEKKFTFPITIESKGTFPAEAWDNVRRQMNAEIVLQSWPKPRDDHEMQILVMNSDLYSRDLNFVFSSASFGGKVVLSSLARLSATNQGTTNEIIAHRHFKTLLRTLGRSFGLWDSEGCAMAFSNALEELDRKSEEYCPNDHKRLIQAKVLRSKE